MPAAAPSRQPGASNRFSGSEAHRLLAAEREWLAAQMSARPARPWLWLAPPSDDPPGWPLPPPRGVLLRQAGDGYEGTVRCGLPWPLANECLGDVVLQHPWPHQLGTLLDECARVLVEGGRLWLFQLNPWSPYRIRRMRGLPAMSTVPWMQPLRARGLHPGAPVYIGPRWRASPPGDETAARREAAGDATSLMAPLRACSAIVAEKRGLAPMAPAPVAWRRGAAPAA